MIKIKVVKNDYDPNGTYTHQILWELDKCISGFIVQRVEIEDPLHIIDNYECPYYEAWDVKDGNIIYDGKRISRSFDDEFSNEQGGIIRYSIQEHVQQLMTEKQCDESYIAYRCKVYFAEEGSALYRIVSAWETGKVSMAGNMLRSSKNLGVNLGKEEFKREKCWVFTRQQKG